MLLMISFASSLQSTATTTDEIKNIITVSGQGEIFIKPDIAIVNIGVLTDDKSLSEAYKINNKKLTDILKKLGELGVKKEDIQTNSYNVYPTYDYSVPNVTKLTGYQVSNNLSVTIRKIESAGRILESAVIQKANTISGLQFKTADSQAQYAEAIKLAIKNAEGKAKTMTDYFNINGLKPISMKEISSIDVQPIYYDKAVMNSGSDSTRIEAGNNSIKANVEIQFQF